MRLARPVALAVTVLALAACTAAAPGWTYAPAAVGDARRRATAARASVAPSAGRRGGPQRPERP